MADEVPPEEVVEGESEDLTKWVIYGISLAVFAVFVPILSKVSLFLLLRVPEKTAG